MGQSLVEYWHYLQMLWKDPWRNPPRSRKAVLGPDTFPVVWHKMTTSRSGGREGESELGQKPGQQKSLPTRCVSQKVEKEMPPVKTHARAEEFLAERAATGGNELAGGREYYFV